MGVVVRTTPGDPAKDLAAGRTQFLPFSAAAVDLVKLARKARPAFAGQKIYRCPMGAPTRCLGASKSPFALSGGVFLQYLLGYNFSVAVWVGYIALFGTAIETAIVMVV
jgi:hypothetical protein